jgi:hypothetical protein
MSDEEWGKNGPIGEVTLSPGGVRTMWITLAGTMIGHEDAVSEGELKRPAHEVTAPPAKATPYCFI